MALQGPFPVECAALFPHGLGVVGAVSAVDDFNASTKERKVQARDKDTGLPVWQIDVMDFDPEARERTFKVKVAAAVQPVPPEAVAGLPVRPVVLEGLTVTPWIKEVPRGKAIVSVIAYSVRATGLAAPRQVRAGDAPKAA